MRYCPRMVRGNSRFRPPSLDGRMRSSDHSKETSQRHPVLYEISCCNKPHVYDWVFLWAFQATHLCTMPCCQVSCIQEAKHSGQGVIGENAVYNISGSWRYHLIALGFLSLMWSVRLTLRIRFNGAPTKSATHVCISNYFNRLKVVYYRFFEKQSIQALWELG